MTQHIKHSAALLPIAIVLAACSATPETPKSAQKSTAAQHTFVQDVSDSVSMMNNPTVAQGVERVIGDHLIKSVALFDRITLYQTGERTAERMTATLRLATDYGLRVPVARRKILEAMQDNTQRFVTEKGDKGTNLLLSLETIRPACTARSTITLITDGIEESEAYSASRALMAGKAVTLPAPPDRYLSGGCRIIFVGFGLTDDPGSDKGQLLPAKSLAALRLGWTDYLTAAGVRPEHIEFISAL